ncbi:hypothetical protein [Gimesia sp.]|uniref:hypothetical protein n=1 Tax=Gimesia sp. TaxID=2024833 RepID=UPI003A92AC64
MESRAGAVCLEAVRSWLIVRISFGLQSDVAKKEIEFLQFEKWGDSTGVSAPRPLRHHPHLLETSKLSNRLRTLKKWRKLNLEKIAAAENSLT